MKKSNFSGILLSLAMAIGLMAAMSVTAWAEEVHTHGGITFQPWTSTNSMPSQPGNYYLTVDVSTSGWDYWEVPEGTTNLCLDGHTISHSGRNRTINVGKNAQLNLYDKEDNSGKITSSNTYNNGVSVNGGIFTMKGGSIESNTNSGVYVDNSGTFTMEGGVIKNNTSNSNNAGVMVRGSSNFIMTGGSITGNSYTGGYGGVVLFDSNGSSTFTMTGGSITDNKGEAYGGVTSNSGTIRLAGDVDISGNKAADDSEHNVYLKKTKINLIGALTNTAPVKVYMDTKFGGIFASGTAEVKAGDYLDKFTNENTKFALKAEGDDLKLAREESVTYLDADGTEKKVDSYALLSEFNLSSSYLTLEEGCYIVDKEYEIPAARPTVNGIVTLILCDESTLNAKKGFEVYCTGSKKNTLNIYGQSTGEKAGKLVAVADNNKPAIGNSSSSYSSGTVNIYGGNIQATGGANAAAIGGGYASSVGLYGGTVRLYGGTLEATAGDGAVAIGAGKGNDDHGVVILGKGIGVLAGDDEANAEDVTASFVDKHNQTWVKTSVRKPISATVTFKVANGSWNEGEGDAAKADKTVELTGLEGDTLKLAADQIPAVGAKPDEGYKAGSWDTEPSTETAITKDTTYTYTYAAREASDAVIDKIKALPAGKDVTANDRKDIEAARKAYDELDADQKAKVSEAALTKLQTAEAVLDALDRATAAEAAKKDAEDAKKAAEDAKAKAEADKATAQAAQKAAEDAKTKAEADKATAEAAKKAAEDAKTKAEADKATAEAAKKAAEDAKTKAEADKATAQAAQKAAEDAKAVAEAAQKTAEAAQKAAEDAKTKAETDKATAEAAQKAAEDAKAIAEAAKKTAEDAKAKAEADKATAEAAQKAAEDKATAAEAAQKTAEAAQKAAEEKATAAEAAQKAAEDALKGAEDKATAAESKASAAEAAQKIAEDKAAAAAAAQKAAEEKAAAAEAAQKAAEEKAAEAEKNAFKPLAKVKLNKKTKGGNAKIRVKWSTVDGARGYQIKVSKNKKGTKKVRYYTVKGEKKTSKVIKRLKKGNYYVRVRAYKTHKGNTVYGEFSKVKKVKVKK